ncbi:MAG: hypothetical protein ABIT71_26570 [Vicinamibacteraceae bacterium]
MTSAELLKELVGLHARSTDAQRRMVNALEADDLLGLVEASQAQGALCTEQGALLADYVATVMTNMPDLDPTHRERITYLASQFREDHLDAKKKGAGR